MLSDFVVAVAGSELGISSGSRLGVEEHERLGDVDCVVPGEAAAIEMAKRYLSLLLVDHESGEPNSRS